jgi:hypothetical protein
MTEWSWIVGKRETYHRILSSGSDHAVWERLLTSSGTENFKGLIDSEIKYRYNEFLNEET